MATTDALRFGHDHPAQRRFVESDARYAAYIAGIGSGKTVGGIGRLIRNVTQLNPGYTGYVLAPTVPSLRNVIIPELDKWGVLDRAEYNRTEKKLRFPNGSTVIFESADNDRKIERLRGPSIAWFWMDEAATISSRAWDVMIGRLREGDHLNAYVTTTPKGKNWLYDTFVNADTRLDGADVVRGVPSTENPHLPDAYGDIISEYDGRFYEQEVEGEFVGFEGLVYPWFGDDNIAPTDALPDRFDRVVYGVDWGFANPSVALAVGYRDGQPIVLDEIYRERLTVEDLAARLGDLQDRHGDGVVYCDPAEPASIEQLRRAGFDTVAAENEVRPGIQHVTSRQDELRVADRCQNLINEFGMYQYRDGGDADRVRKEHDHALDALRYALYTSAARGGVATARAQFGGDGGTGAPAPDEETTVGDVLPDPSTLGR